MKLVQGRMGLAVSTAILAAALAIVPLAGQQAAAGSLGLGGHASGGLGGGLGSAGGTLNGGLAGGLSSGSANAATDANVGATTGIDGVAADTTSNLASSDSLAIGASAASASVANDTGLTAADAGADGNLQLSAKAAVK